MLEQSCLKSSGGIGVLGKVGANCLRCRSVSFGNGNELCIMKELGAVSKPALEHFVVVVLVVNFPQINRSGGSQGFVA